MIACLQGRELALCRVSKQGVIERCHPFASHETTTASKLFLLSPFGGSSPLSKRGRPTSLERHASSGGAYAP